MSAKLLWRRRVEKTGGGQYDIVYEPKELPEGFTAILIMNRDPQEVRGDVQFKWEYRVCYERPDWQQMEDILGLAETLRQAQDIVASHVKRLAGK